MQYGYHPTDLSQSYGLSDASSLHRRLEEQSRAFWRDEETHTSWSAEPLPVALPDPLSRFERALAPTVCAAIAAVWTYLLFS